MLGTGTGTGKRSAAGFTAKIAPDAIRGEQTIAQPAARHGAPNDDRCRQDAGDRGHVRRGLRQGGDRRGGRGQSFRTLHSVLPELVPGISCDGQTPGKSGSPGQAPAYDSVETARVRSRSDAPSFSTLRAGARGRDRPASRQPVRRTGPTALRARSERRSIADRSIEWAQSEPSSRTADFRQYGSCVLKLRGTLARRLSGSGGETRPLPRGRRFTAIDHIRWKVPMFSRRTHR